MVSQIMLFASEVPVICGLNQYQKIEDVFMKVWKRTAPEQVDECVETHIEQVIKLMEKIDTESKISDFLATAAKATSIEEVAESINRIHSVIPASETAQTKKEIANVITSKINCSFGTTQEAPAIALYEKKYAATISNRNDKFYKRKIIDIGNCSIIVGGKVDGLRDDKIIEIKNRMRKFFTPLPSYDVAQLQTYLFILDLTKGELVEQLKGSKTNIKSTPITRDEEMWASLIEPKLIQFSVALLDFINDTSLQQKFVLGDQQMRKTILDTLL